jgi:hypothetical protein
MVSGGAVKEGKEGNGGRAMKEKKRGETMWTGGERL